MTNPKILLPLPQLSPKLDKRIAGLEATSSISVSEASKNSTSTVNSDDTSIASTTSENSKVSGLMSADSVDATLASTATEKSKNSGRMSTSSAKVRQLDDLLQRYKLDSAQQQAKQSDRVSQMERQLQRVQEVDSKLDAIQTDFVSRLTLFEGRMEESMNLNMTKLIEMVQNINSNPSSTYRSGTPQHQAPRSPTTADSLALQQINTHQESDGSSTLELLSSKASMTSVESLDQVQSPEHKKLKSAGKRSKKIKLKDSIRRRLDELNGSSSLATDNMDTQAPGDSLDQLPEDLDSFIEHQESTDSFDEIADEMDPMMTNSKSHDPESQYTTNLGTTEANHATPSPGRESDS